MYCYIFRKINRFNMYFWTAIKRDIFVFQKKQSFGHFRLKRLPLQKFLQSDPKTTRIGLIPDQLRTFNFGLSSKNRTSANQYRMFLNYAVDGLFAVNTHWKSKQVFGTVLECGATKPSFVSAHFKMT